MLTLIISDLHIPSYDMNPNNKLISEIKFENSIKFLEKV